MARYLISGVAGFIAARVAEMLLDQGHEVVGLDNLNHAYDVRLKEYRLRCLQDKFGDKKRTSPFTFYAYDISERGVIEQLSQTYPQDGYFDAVINLAARAGVRASVEDPWVYVDTNVHGTLNLLEFSRRKAIPKFILASTSSVYGENAPLPTPETYDSSSPLQPYAASKKGAEVLCHAYHYLYNIDVTVFRYFTVYGPAGRPDMSMFRFVQWINEGRKVLVNGDGEQTRGFTYVDDIARGTLQGLMPLGYEIINLGGHETISINQLIQMIEQLLGKKAQLIYGERHPADMLSNWADVSKARRLLGWQPEVSLSEGVARLVAWYREQQAWVSQVSTT